MLKKSHSILLWCIAIAFALQTAEAQRKAKVHAEGKSFQDQKSVETQFDRLVQAQSIGENIKQLSAEPHHLGSAGGKRVADAILAKFKEYGWDASIETYKVLFPTPKTRILELIEPQRFVAGLQELPVAEDPTTGQSGQLPTYVAWSADGDVTADLVYVNFGLPSDYEQLNRLGVDVKGKIVIARYGRSWRGTKPKVAFEHGAVGCIIYSDPKEDGYFQGDGYPAGAFKNEYTVQRGSVMDMVIYPGDPLTPGIGATESAKRLKREDATTILKIPVLPISYHDALPLLSALGGEVAPAEWRGALPITYKVGGTGTLKVHLKTEFNWDLVPAYDVIAKIKGSDFPDEWVIRGNHHDAWVNGASDPISGQAALLEEAKAIGQLVKAGYKPKRTLVYCAWDGEEQSLLGSTEWAEDHQKELEKKAVAYINTDGNGRGFLGAEGSHAFEQFVTDIAKDVKDPQTGVSVFERLRAAEAVRAVSAKQKQEALSKTTLKLGALGTGSDYSSFLQHIGIPTLSFGFGGESAGGEYHSIYDSYANYVRFKDPGFVYGVALSQVVGRAVLRLADANVLPLDYRSFHQTVNTYLTEVKKLAEQTREESAVENKLIVSGAYKLAPDPKQHLAEPALKDSVPSIDFTSLQTSIDSLGKSTKILYDLQVKLASSTDKRKEKVNEILFQAEKSLLIDNGLPRRPWYKHSIYAPGFYTGYGVKTLPGIREAIEERHWQEAKEQISVVALTIQKLNQTINTAIDLVKSIL
ncbi:MAG: transferrin receptor-like dimerization domain-containing protein [Bacteroidota bacterium]|nr:transferrin receptor-like dimerization domain-containing protein [Bacteroidota bacterium]